MNRGIAGKLSITYFTIIIAIVVSGLFCLYVLRMNSTANEELTSVTMPSLEELKELKSLMQDAKKLTNSRAFADNNKDHERLTLLLEYDFPLHDSMIRMLGKKWYNPQELRYLNEIVTNNKYVLKKILNLTAILNSDESYVNDKIMEQADEINTFVTKMVGINDKLLDKLIVIKKENLRSQQRNMAFLLTALYCTIFFTIIVVLIVTILSLRFAKKSIVTPLLDLNKIILQIAKGEVVIVPESHRADEIGQIQNAISKMVDAAIQKIDFAEHIGHGDYDRNFSLLSKEDKLGVALLSMRDNLAETHKILLEQDKRLRDAQRMAKVGNYFYDVKTRTYQSSVTFDEISGIYDEKDKNGDNWMSLVSSEYKDEIRKVAKTGDEHENVSQQYKIRQHGTGKEIWVDVRRENIYDPAGNVVSVVGTMQDITESKTLETDLNRSYEIAIEQNKRLANFSYIVSHNLRMHTVNIQGLLKLYSEASDEGERKEIFQMLTKAAEQLDDTMFHLNEVVTMQNSAGIEVGPIDLNVRIGRALNTLNVVLTNKNAIIQNNIPANTIVNYNPSYIDSILLNLISNAVKYCSPDRQPIVVLDFYPAVKGTDDNGNILQVSDNGIGIDMEMNGHKLFGMYKTFHGNKDAKGLGLFMVKYQVEAMGGRIEVFSELNKGTTFKVYIK